MERKKTREEVFNDYDGFVDKFKPKKTTDDCYTPPCVYEAVKEWVNDNITPLEGVEVVRPFWPGGDFEKFDYPENCIVIDNPPFSILSKIRRFYHSRNIKYFLFAPSTTLANSAKELDATYIICGDSIEYENGAKVSTSFVTNLECEDVRIWVAGGLSEQLREVQKDYKASHPKVELPVYTYPEEVTSPALLQKVSKRGVDLRIKNSDCTPVHTLDSQREKGKSIYGGGWLLSEKAAAEKAAEKAAAFVWELSEREKEIVRSLGKSKTEESK